MGVISEKLSQLSVKASRPVAANQWAGCHQRWPTRWRRMRRNNWCWCEIFRHFFLVIWAFALTHWNKKAKPQWKQTKSSVWSSFQLLFSIWLCLLPPSYSLFLLLYPQTPSSVFSLHRWVIPHQNNGLLCFIELPLSHSYFLISFPPFICHAPPPFFFLFRSLSSFSLSSHF